MSILLNVISLFMTSQKIRTKSMKQCGQFQVCNILFFQVNFNKRLLATNFLFNFLWKNFIVTEIHSDLDKLEKPKMFILVSSVMTWARSKIT